MRKFLGVAVLAIAPLASNAAEFKFRGFMKAEVVSSNNSVGSFSNKYSHVAVTRANPVAAASQRADEASATSFQTNQSRFAFDVTQGKTSGTFEFDLIDPGTTGFSNQTPLQGSGPRTRLMVINHKLNDNVTLFIGQKWSTAAGIAGIGSYNFVGNGFQAGKVAFLNEEAGATYKMSDFSFTGAITGKGKNATASGIGSNENEYGFQPGFAANGEYKASNWMVGVAAHVAKLRWVDANNAAGNTNVAVNPKDSKAGLAKVYGSTTMGSFKLDVEAYTGTNVSNLNALGVAKAGNGNTSWREAGFWSTLTYTASEEGTVKLGYGQAAVNAEDARSKTGAAGTPLLGAADMRNNSFVFLNYGHNLGDGLTAFAQVTRHSTSYGTGATDKHFNAMVGQAGMLYKF